MEAKMTNKVLAETLLN